MGDVLCAFGGEGEGDAVNGRAVRGWDFFTLLGKGYSAAFGAFSCCLADQALRCVVPGFMFAFRSFQLSAGYLADELFSLFQSFS